MVRQALFPAGAPSHRVHWRPPLGCRRRRCQALPGGRRKVESTHHLIAVITSANGSTLNMAGSSASVVSRGAPVHPYTGALECGCVHGITVDTARHVIIGTAPYIHAWVLHVDHVRRIIANVHPKAVDSCVSVLDFFKL